MAGSQLAGVVNDSSGGVLPGVEVTITKTDTGIDPHRRHRRRRWLRLSEPAGRPVSAQGRAAGFNTYVQDGIVLQVNTNPTIDVTLTVGNIGEQVTVTANIAMVETRSTGVGQVIDNEQVTRCR